MTIHSNSQLRCVATGSGALAPDLPRDEAVISAAEESAYVAALTRNGFKGPDSWYVNAECNTAFAEKARERWRLKMPVLFLHAAYDPICETLKSRLAEPMRQWCDDLEEVVVASGHWMSQEKPIEVNAALCQWLARKVTAAWQINPLVQTRSKHFGEHRSASSHYLHDKL